MEIQNNMKNKRVKRLKKIYNHVEYSNELKKITYKHDAVEPVEPLPAPVHF